MWFKRPKKDILLKYSWGHPRLQTYKWMCYCAAFSTSGLTGGNSLQRALQPHILKLWPPDPVT